VTLKDGRTLSGIIRSRTAQAVVVAMPGETATVSREDILREEISDKSLMPEGLLDALNDQQVADLTAYLTSKTPPPASGGAGR
jgi:putative heme-binding domain-containing protein